MDKWMDSPWFLRITALLLALLLFLTIKADQNATDLANRGTQSDVIRDVPVEVYYDDDNFVVTGVPKAVDLRIEGPPAQVQSIRNLRDFTVFVDLRNMTMGEHQVTIQHENISGEMDVKIDPGVVTVNIEERVTKEFRVEPEMNERLLAENYVITGIESETERISVTGAKSVIDSISFVKASVAADQGVKESFTKEADVRVLDRDLNKLSVSMEPATVTVKVTIEQYSKTLPLDLQEQGTPPDGVTINSLRLKTASVRVYGNKGIIDALDSLPVSVDVSKLNESSTVEGKVTLPDGVTKIDPEKIEIEANITKQDETAMSRLNEPVTD
ncbi:YbbR-like domain-containing protein [Paenisporosarcina cavernae]|uniref:YbbR-like domain-containing protein n=1 Tax=Paenisporosarcina cavernae TaxID=2320858 RepID=A0A385YVR1_9BACL|nr:CdaR family protein [Paenisporosarcina cavernae]AYC30561.1 hypothetical protein D3873_12245 [Paenisporosarcina cavernae]